MAEIEYQNKQALVKLNNFEILKVITQLIFSVSLFSIFFAQSSWLSFPHFFNRLHFHQLSHTIDKNYIFLLCNGLLVFLAKYSGLIRSLSKANRNDEILKAYENISLSDPLMAERHTPLVEREVSIQRNGSASDVTEERGKEIRENWMEDEAVEEKTLYPVFQKDKAGRSDSFVMSEKGDEGKAEGEAEENAIFGEEESEGEGEGEGEDEGNEMLSAEELNRKFDDFIRRMKEEIRTQAQAQAQPQSSSISSDY